MNKKYIAFGFLGVFAFALVSAGLVNYLSDTTTADISVESPILMEVYDGSDWVIGGTVLLDGFGGETQTFNVKTTNQADVPISGGIKTVITNTDGVTCGDFNDIEMTTTIDGTAYGPESVLAACSQQDANTVQILLPYNYGEDNKPTWQPREVDRTQVDASFKSNALGNYSFETTIIPA